MPKILWIHVYIDEIGYKVVNSYSEIEERYDDMKTFPPDGDWDEITITTALFDNTGEERDLLSCRLREIEKYLRER